MKLTTNKNKTLYTVPLQEVRLYPQHTPVLVMVVESLMCGLVEPIKLLRVTGCGMEMTVEPEPISGTDKEMQGQVVEVL